MQKLPFGSQCTTTARVPLSWPMSVRCQTQGWRAQLWKPVLSCGHFPCVLLLHLDRDQNWDWHQDWMGTSPQLILSPGHMETTVSLPSGGGQGWDKWEQRCSRPRLLLLPRCLLLRTQLHLSGGVRLAVSAQSRKPHQGTPLLHNPCIRPLLLNKNKLKVGLLYRISPTLGVHLQYHLLK